MSKESIKRQIEGYKRDIDSQKAKIANCKEDIAKIKIRKSRDTESYGRKLKSVSSTATRHSIRAQKKRDWESYARQIQREKDQINSFNKRILGYREYKKGLEKD